MAGPEKGTVIREYEEINSKKYPFYYSCNNIIKLYLFGLWKNGDLTKSALTKLEEGRTKLKEPQRAVWKIVMLTNDPTEEVNTMLANYGASGEWNDFPVTAMTENPSATSPNSATQVAAGIQ